MEPPDLVRQGDAGRVSEAFHERYAGKLTEVRGIAPLRYRLYTMCLDGDARIDWTAVAALKTHVSLQEALELEAVACVAGDRRHEFQRFYTTWMDEQRRASKDTTKLGQLDIAQVLKEIEMTRQAIDEHEELLAEYRLALLDGKPTQHRPEDIDAIHATVASLRGNLPAMEAELERVMAEHRDGGASASKGAG